MSVDCFRKDLPEDDEANDRHARRGGGEGLSECCEDYEDQLKTIHPLSADHIGQPTEANLTDDSTATGSDLDGSVRSSWNVSGVLLCVLPVNDSEHVGYHIDRYFLMSARFTCSAKNHQPKIS